MIKKILVAFLAGFLSGSCASNSISIQTVKPPTQITVPASSVTNYDSNKKHPTIVYVGDIDDSGAEQFITYLNSDFKNGASDIDIRISSPGGSVLAGLNIVSAMNDLNLKTHCMVDGQAQSMAFFILQNCSERIMTTNSILMAHEPHLYLNQIVNRYDLQQLEQILNESSELMNTVESKRMGMSLKDFEDKVADKDWNFDYQEALRYHAIDKVVEKLDPIPK